MTPYLTDGIWSHQRCFMMNFAEEMINWETSFHCNSSHKVTARRHLERMPSIAQAGGATTQLQAGQCGQCGHPVLALWGWWSGRKVTHGPKASPTAANSTLPCHHPCLTESLLQKEDLVALADMVFRVPPYWFPPPPQGRRCLATILPLQCRATWKQPTAHIVGHNNGQP